MKNLFTNTEYDSIVNRIHQLTPSSINRWGKMTVNQMLCHISDPIRDILGIRITEPVTPPEIRPQIISMVLVEEDWPTGLPTFPPYSQDVGGGGTKPIDFETDRKELMELLNKMYNANKDFNFHPHAGLGIVSREQFGQFIWKHTDHHLREFGV